MVNWLMIVWFCTRYQCSEAIVIMLTLSQGCEALINNESNPFIILKQDCTMFSISKEIN